MRSKDLITINDPKSLPAESYKMFRTNLSYMSVDKEKKVILFTSSLAEEGKTTSVSNTAISFALDGQKTLLIECDLRRARIHEVFNIPQLPGLTNVLTGKNKIEEVTSHIEEIPGLYVIPAGALPPAPAEMLASQALTAVIEEARKNYDMILIDAPPVLNVTDAIVLNRLVDGVVLVVAANESKKEIVKKAKKTLDKVEANILGVLISKMDLKRNGYGYYAHGYSYGEPTKKERRQKAKEQKKLEKENEKVQGSTTIVRSES